MTYPKTKLCICSKCGAYTFVSTHHRLKQKAWRRKLYGDLLDDPRNCVYNLCNDKCHKKADSNDILSEQEFCDIMGILPRSKTGR